MKVADCETAGRGGRRKSAESALGWIGRLQDWTRGLTTRGLGALAFLAGVLSILSMAPFCAWPVLWLTLPILMLAAEAAGARPAVPGRFMRWRRWRVARSAEIGWWFGFGYHLAGLFWIGHAFLVEADVFGWLLPFAVTLLPAGLALFTAAAVALMSAQRTAAPTGRVLMLAVGFGVTEWLRGHILTGLPWNVLGYALTWPAALMQSASVVGIYGLTLVVVVVFAGPFALLQDARARGTAALVWIRRSVILAVVPMTAMGLWGQWRLASQSAGPPKDSGVRVRLVQPSIPQAERLLAGNQRRIFDQHLALSLTAPDGSQDGAAGIGLIVWPEAAMPFLPLSQPVALDDIGTMLPVGTALLSGALRTDPATPLTRQRVYNSALLFVAGAPARHLATYDKVHLVPFGEYLPLQQALEAIGLQQLTRQRGGFDAGKADQPDMSIPGLGHVRILICYEAIFPIARANDDVRPDVLVTLTNDSWFGDTTGPRQHLLQAQVRSAELGIPMIRASANGISASIDGHGVVRERLALDAVGTLDIRVPRLLPTTFYARFGDVAFVLAVAVFLAAASFYGRSSSV